MALLNALQAIQIVQVEHQCAAYYWCILNAVIDGACKRGTAALQLNTGFLII